MVKQLFNFRVPSVNFGLFLELWTEQVPTPNWGSILEIEPRLSFMLDKCWATQPQPLFHHLRQLDNCCAPGYQHCFHHGYGQAGWLLHQVHRFCLKKKIRSLFVKLGMCNALRHYLSFIPYPFPLGDCGGLNKNGSQGLIYLNA